MKKSELNSQLSNEWQNLLTTETKKDYFIALKKFLESEYSNHKVFPPKRLLLNAFYQTPFNDVKVVIIGQDPYHGDLQANGLCFSVNKGLKLPPSLKNIIKELKDDVGIPEPNHGDLTVWAQQGILLLNTCLSVRAHQPLSHQNQGWEQFTDAVISYLSSEKENIVFLVWGRKAQMKAETISKEKHHVLSAQHPSPFSAHKGFFGCKHFSKTNEILLSQGKKPINWEII